jgi:nitrite reductase (NO-forming)
MNAPNAVTRPHHSKTKGGEIMQRARANFRAKDGLRIAFGLIWAIDAGFKWQPGFRQGFMGMVMEEGKGQPGWLHGWFHFWVNVQHPHTTFFAYTGAITETVIALSLIFGFARMSIYVIGALFSLTIWGTSEGFGGPYGTTSTDIGAAVMYAVVFAALLALNYEAGESRFSVDYLIEKRVSWWHHIAEVRPRREHEEPSRTAPPIMHTPISSDVTDSL